jgi:hypothetical protein
MLKLDVARSSDEELADAVAERCSSLGAVGKVTVYSARGGTPARPFAIVAMGTREAAESVCARFGGRTVGSAVIVFLEQLAETIPAIGAGMRAIPDNVVSIEKAVRP